MFKSAVWRRFASTGETAKAKLDEFLIYHKTDAKLKPFIYRPKNAQILLTKDIRDPKTREPLQPRSPVKPLSKQTLSDFIYSVKPNSTELLDWFKEWTGTSIRKRAIWSYISPIHVQKMLTASFFKIGKYAHMVGLLYGIEHKFLKAQNPSAFDIEHFFNTNIMCALHRNKLRNYTDAGIAQRKLQVAWKKVLNRKNNTGLANILVATLGRQVGFTPEVAGLQPVQISLPDIPNSLSGAELKDLLYKYEGTYLIVRTLLDIDQHNAEYLELQEFIRQYQSALGETNDPYDTHLKSLEQLETQPPQETTEKEAE
ncbi:mitochondrial 37S ribosomal protein mS44 MRP13 [Saccharomyces paradoxus]|uniref:Mitochondrial 37S ribosomal protein mS44 MRP13 n=1 Tax=Saccharomyces paradoxus TaxID=27291 RepID=A0A8B8URL8_SACPA|nr:Mrp13 [Saccharomyces paradoxus]QHS73395.1 Mrp13 [Saccharomyces paradoxus]